MGFSNKPHNLVAYVKIQGLKVEEPEHYFEVNGEKTENKVFEGRLTDIVAHKYEYPKDSGKFRDTIKFSFVDDSVEYYQLDISYNSISRGIMNSLLGYIDSCKSDGIESGKLNMELSLYFSKDNYKKCGLKVNGSRTNWRWDIDAQKSMISTIEKKNGDKEREYFDFDKKIMGCIPEVKSFITPTTEKSDIEASVSAVFGPEPSIEDIPY